MEARGTDISTRKTGVVGERLGAGEVDTAESWIAPGSVFVKS